jgi:hypothetical protein
LKLYLGKKSHLSGLMSIRPYNNSTWFHSSLLSNTFCTRASSALMAKIGSCKLEKGYCYLIDHYQSKLKLNTKTDCKAGCRLKTPLKSSEWVIVVYKHIMPTQQIFIYIMARTSWCSMGKRWGLLYTRSTRLVGFSSGVYITINDSYR